MLSLYSLWTSIKTTVVWLPIIWRDRDWDYSFLFSLLQFKLKRMEKLFRERGCHVSATKDARRMRICCLLLGRLIDDRYMEMAFRAHGKKWGKLEVCWEEPIEMWRSEITPETEAQERDESRRCYKHEDYLRRQDLEYLLHLFRKYIFSWWD